MEEEVRVYLEDAERTVSGKTAMTASELLNAAGIRNPSNANCKEAGSVLRELYGPLKRINGFMKWHVPGMGHMAVTAKPMDDLY